MPPPPTRQLIVTDLRKIKDGHTSGGDAYTLWQVRATSMDGIPIDSNLRTFDNIPLDVPVTVTVEKFSSTRGYGDSFTLELVEDGATATSAAPSAPPPINAPPPPPDLAQRLNELAERVASLEAELKAHLSEGGGTEPPTEVPPEAGPLQQPVW